MDSGSIITLVVGGLTGLSLIILGIYQYRKPTPVSFYTGEEPPNANKLKSVSGWNRGHGRLWMGYGLIIIISYAVAVFVTADYLVKTLIMFCGPVFPAFLLVLGHHCLIKKYLL